jgi:hypothetical protein
MSEAHDLYLLSGCLEYFADRLVQACGRVGSADAQTTWQSASASAYRLHLVDLRVDLRAAAAQARASAADLRAKARLSAQSR